MSELSTHVKDAMSEPFKLSALVPWVNMYFYTWKYINVRCVNLFVVSMKPVFQTVYICKLLVYSVIDLFPGVTEPSYSVILLICRQWDIHMTSKRIVRFCLRMLRCSISGSLTSAWMSGDDQGVCRENKQMGKFVFCAELPAKQLPCFLRKERNLGMSMHFL